MRVVALIERKRDGGALTAGEWAALMAAYARGDVPDYQMAALAMACLLRGLDADETAALTDALLASGARLDFGDWPVPRVDKHSTGGVGDKVSLALAPLVAACGVAVPMMSGRSLGHTGGTLDKLESIPGFRVGLSLAEARAQVERFGLALFGQTDEVAPADRRLYALRDATATVPALPLIAASIMSKKLAEGLTGLVLDVKAGNGAFIGDPGRGAELARTMIALGRAHGLPVVALQTAMDRPLGRACGNALEVAEAVAVLRGGGPSELREVMFALGAEMLVLGGVAADVAAARAQLAACLADGSALERWRAVVAAQGGDPRVADDPQGVLPRAPVREIATASHGGTVTALDTRALGDIVVALGGGRTRVDDIVDPAVGLVMAVQPGDLVHAGDPLAEVHARDAATAAAAVAAVRAAVTVGDAVAAPLPLVLARHA
jgi:pyrimidine-nucleoside phosphorylase